MTLAIIHVGVCGGEDNPFGLALLYDSLHLVRVANIDVGRAKTDYFIAGPFTHKFLAQ